MPTPIDELIEKFRAEYNGTDLEMVMDKIVLGLYLALENEP